MRTTLFKVILLLSVCILPVLSQFSIPVAQSSETFSEEQFGHQALFWINIPELVQMRATLLAKGNWSYIYMANETIALLGENVSISKCEALSHEFDSTIYPKAIEVAGNPDGNLGDIDGDPHITIFLAPLVRHYGDNSVLGYYDGRDDDPHNPYSNLREMVYVDSEHSLPDTYCIIAHELNHMIWGNYEYDEAEFLTEGLANYAVDFCRYFSRVTDAVANAFTHHPEISLLYFVREYGQLWDASYGQAYLFLTYLANRFGNDFTRELVSIAADGATSLDVAFSRFGYNLTFNDVYLDWITACTLDNPTFADGIYGFGAVYYAILSQTLVHSSIQKQNVKQYYYGFNVICIHARWDNFTFAIDNPYPNALGISIAFVDDNGWNVTQVFNTRNSERICLYVEGKNIRIAYVITSLMSPGTPSDFGIVYNLAEVPSESLNYSLYEGAPTVAAFHSQPAIAWANDSLTFNATASHSVYGDIAAYQWDFGDGSTTTAFVPTVEHTYSSTGRYNVTLNVTSIYGVSSVTSSLVAVTFFTDLNKDAIVNMVDVSTIAVAFSSTSSSPNWNPKADLNNDSVINIVDISAIAKDFGKTV